MNKTTISIPHLKAKARGALTGHYLLFITAIFLGKILLNLPTLVVSMGETALQVFIYFGILVIVAFLGAIFTVGQNYMCLRCAAGDEPVPITDMWYGFKGRADHILQAYGLYVCKIIFCIVCVDIAFLLGVFPGKFSLDAATGHMLAIPFCLIGIFAAIKFFFDYSQLLWLLAEDDTTPSRELVHQSMTMIRGHRLQLVKLYLSFIGVALLIPLSFGIAIFWVLPYVKMTLAQFYLSIKNNP